MDNGKATCPLSIDTGSLTLPNNQILTLTKLKVSADDKFDIAK